MAKNTIDDLKDDILQLKRQLANIKNENQMLTVKNRKLDDELKKKTKQLFVQEEYDKSRSQKAATVSGNISTICTLNMKIDYLEKKLCEKDLRLKKFENELFLAKMYISKFTEKCSRFTRYGSKLMNEYSEPESRLTSRRSQQSHQGRFERSKRSLSITPRSDLKRPEDVETLKQINDDLKVQYERLTKDNLLVILSKLKCLQTPATVKPNKNENENVNDDISMLYNYVDKMYKEIEELRLSISKMESGDSNHSVHGQVQGHSKSLEHLVDAQSDIVEEIDNFDIDLDNFLEQ